MSDEDVTAAIKEEEEEEEGGGGWESRIERDVTLIFMDCSQAAKRYPGGFCCIACSYLLLLLLLLFVVRVTSAILAWEVQSASSVPLSIAPTLSPSVPLSFSLYKV